MATVEMMRLSRERALILEFREPKRRPGKKRYELQALDIVFQMQTVFDIMTTDSKREVSWKDRIAF